MPFLPHPASSLALVLALSGCGSSISASPGTAPDAGSATDAASLVTTLDGAACPAPSTLPPAAACAGLTELAAPANAVPGAADAYALADLPPTQDTSRPSCLVEPWQNRADARVRFTAPRGGRWRFTAAGEELWSLDLRRGCDAVAGCTGFPDVHGPHASGSHSIDVQVQRGESIGVTLDGCPMGTACRYTLRAERIAELACEFDPETPAVCAGEREACSVDPCDAERFECLTVASRAPTLTSLRVLSEGPGGRAVYEGRSLVGDPSVGGRSGSLMGRWLDASGATLTTSAWLGQATVSPDGTLSGVANAVPRGAARGVFRFYDGTRPEWEGGVEASVERWAPPSEGEGCESAALASRCDVGLRCVTTGGGARGVCRRSRAIEVTELRAWRDDAAGSLRLAVAGLGADRALSRLSIELLDEGGAVLASAPLVAPVFQQEWPSMVPFSTSLEVSNDPSIYRPAGIARDLRVTPSMTRVRVAAIDTSEQRSAPVEAAVRATTAVALGALCDDPSVSCAAGLTCASQGGTIRRRCEPTTAPRACGMSGRSPTWAPPAVAGTYRVEGVAHAIGGGPGCYTGRTQRATAMEFVAPVAGRYGFELRGFRALSVGAGCGEPVCELAPIGSSEVRVEVALAAGQRVPLELSSDRELQGTAAYSLSVRVP
nr:hypothetical protein [Deltaproteobacteria bacterium]